MICSTCGTETSRIRVIRGTEYCHQCGGFQEAGGVRTDGLLTRNAFRVRSEAVKHEGDTIHPYMYDKGTRKIVPNERFIAQFPDYADEYYTDDMITESHSPKLTSHLKDKKAAQKAHKEQLSGEVQMVGDTEKAIKKIL